MATRIEFSKHGGPEVLQAVEFTLAILRSMKFRSKTKLSASIISTPMFAAASIRRRRCRAVWAPRRPASSVKSAMG